MCICMRIWRGLVNITILVQNVIDNLISTIVWMLVQLTEEPPNVPGYAPVFMLGSDPDLAPDSSAATPPPANDETEHSSSPD